MTQGSSGEGWTRFVRTPPMVSAAADGESASNAVASQEARAMSPAKREAASSRRTLARSSATWQWEVVLTWVVQQTTTFEMFAC